MRENFAGCGKMILGSDSHTRYGALGTMAVGEGGGELAKQLLRDTYDVAYPGVVAIYLTGAPRPGVGPHDVALAIIRAVFAKGYVKNKVMEFVGPGIASVTTDYRNGVDVMTTETTCLSSIWATDEDTHAFLAMHGRGDDYRELKPADVAYYDGCVEVDLSSIKPMIALPFHPSNGFEIDELNENLEDILHEVELEAAKIGEGKTHFSLLDKIVDGKLHVQQGVIAGCSGGNYDSVVQAARVLKGANTGCGEFSLSVYPTSQPVALELTRRGYIYDLMEAGAIVRTAFCGPCFGAGDTPANNGLSIRHTTRNFPNREGSKPGNGQLSAVALMDARSIAATAANGGVLTPATDLPEETWDEACEYTFDDAPYKSACTGALARRSLPTSWSRPQHQAVARDGASRRRHPAQGVLQDHGPGHHDRRAHSFGRDELLPLQPAGSGRVYAEPPRPGLRGSFQGGRCRGEAPRCRRGRGRPGGARCRACRCV
ncbi:MAG: hydratase [Collinsella sp.]